MNWLRNWLGITDIRIRQHALEEIVERALMHLDETRSTLDKLSEIVLAYQSKTWVQTEIPVAKKKGKGNG
jgi:hypothetical protein